MSNTPTPTTPRFLAVRKSVLIYLPQSLSDEEAEPIIEDLDGNLSDRLRELAEQFRNGVTAGLEIEVEG